MKILLPTANLPCGHNYLRGFLYDGLRVLGHEVVSYPEAPWLHLKGPHERDSCAADNDQFWLPDAPCDVVQDLAEGRFDLVFDVDAFTQPRYVQSLARVLPAATPLVIVDGTDSAGDNRGAAQVAWSRTPAAYFKRELPLGASWALPCPLTYPRRRVVRPDPARRGVIYYVALHAGTAPMREHIAHGLQARLDALADVRTTPGQGGRPSPEAYHAVAVHRAVGIHWNPTAWPVTDHAHQSGWDGNRFWENLALGLAPVSLRPFIEFPQGTEFTDNLDVLWADTAEEVVEKAVVLVRDHERATALAYAAQTTFLAHHTSDKRAAYVLRAAGIAACV